MSKNLKESNPIGKKCKGQMPEFNIFRFDSRIFIYYIDGWRCGTPNKIVSSDDYIGQFWTMQFFSTEIRLINKNLKESNPIGKKCKG